MTDEPCECCEEPGRFCSGVPGILAAVENGRLVPGTEVQRCDFCERFPGDAAALARLVELGIASTDAVCCPPEVGVPRRAATRHDRMVALLRDILDSDMAMREEDGGQVSHLLTRVRNLLDEVDQAKKDAQMSEPVTPREVYDAYPDVDLLPVSPPRVGETWKSWRRRSDWRSPPCGDSLFQFVCNELADAADEDEEEQLPPRETAIRRIDRGIADLLAVRTAISGEAPAFLHGGLLDQERADVWIASDEGDQQFWVPIGDGRRLHVCIWHDATLAAQLVRISDEELLDILHHGAFGGWEVRAMRIPVSSGLTIAHNGRRLIRDVEDDDAE